jgi:hypothetical protein
MVVRTQPLIFANESREMGRHYQKERLKFLRRTRFGVVSSVSWAPKIVEDLVRKGVRDFYKNLGLQIPETHFCDLEKDGRSYLDVVNGYVVGGSLHFSPALRDLRKITENKDYRLIVVARGDQQETVGQTSRESHAPILISLDKVLACEDYSIPQVTQHELGHCLLNMRHHNNDQRDTAVWGGEVT